MDNGRRVLYSKDSYSIEKSEEDETHKDTEEISLQNVTQQDINAIAELDNLKRLNIVISGEDTTELIYVQ